MRIAIIGNLCGIAIRLAEFLCRKGIVEASVFTDGGSFKGFQEAMGFHKSSFPVYFLEDLSKAALLMALRDNDVIISITGTLAFCWGRLSSIYPLIKRLNVLPRVINLTTGSDITELAADKSLAGMLYRSHLKTSDLNWTANYPWALKNAIALRVHNAVFLPFPMDTDVYNVCEQSNESDTITFFHPSHLDWKETDNKSNRNSSKGNDRFIRAIVRAIKEGLNAKIIMLDRGPDKEIAKQIINDSGVRERFTFKSHMTREELIEHFHKADVIVDQFDVGGFGLTTLEAMACGKPVMIYINKHCANIMYYEGLPILNCSTEEEIYQQIRLSADKNYRREIGTKAREWVVRYHHWEKIIDRLIVYCELLTGKYVEKAHCPDLVKLK
jgi:glycosyltransferase involved in cell wall biosynthesis